MEAFRLIGIALKKKTQNADGASAKDCGTLWQYFEQKQIIEHIPNKISEDIYAVYYDYESDETGLFSYFIGCKVDFYTENPKGLDELIIPKQKYQKFVAQGPMTQCITDAWQTIWTTPLNRKFGFDFEIYDERSKSWKQEEVDIFIALSE